jgi:hypothetical protein
MSRCNFASARRKFDGVLTSRLTQARLHVAPSRMTRFHQRDRNRGSRIRR